ncbi:MAG TPA: LpxL/LpxP family Kdo(2)-lipid IV(A) lauroyl/palmitoleoyl acyltransferase [Rhodanobacteraceae bacterium]
MPGTTLPCLTLRLIAPRHWPAWCGVGVVRLLACLPRVILFGLGSSVGTVLARVDNSRRRIAARNISLCFPQLDACAQRALVNANMHELGAMLASFVFGCLGSDRAIARTPVCIEGLQHLREAHDRGQGVLLLAGHFAHMETCMRVLARHAPVGAMYRRLNSPVIDWLVARARRHHGLAMFDKDDLRDTIKYLRAGGVLWYAPDQDMRSKDHVFVPFFGIPTATITATHHLVRLGRAQVVPFFCQRTADGRYVIRLNAPLDAFPSTDATADTARINQVIEAMVREAPAQYLWAHKRFKTRPPGLPDVYAD